MLSTNTVYRGSGRASNALSVRATPNGASTSAIAKREAARRAARRKAVSFSDLAAASGRPVLWAAPRPKGAGW